MGNKTNKTFVELLDETNVQIPLIQRDYVQGNARTEKEKEKRDDFINKLLDALNNGKEYNLDFIYGAKDDKKETDNSLLPFLPLDGQQRLTTLFLMHWVFQRLSSLREKDAERMAALRKFSYKTRISSDKFCQKITSEDNFCNFSADNSGKSLSNFIKLQSWFVKNLENDPTVQSMMEMIDTIETIVSEKYADNIDTLTERLFNGRYISFEVLNMDKYNLTDNLYIKMNSRGKELTDFENWKADFISFLSGEEKDIFTDRIEHSWNDVFWKIKYKEYSSLSIEEQQKIYPRIDELFMNFFYNIHRMLFFIYTEKEKVDANTFKEGLKSQQDETFKDDRARKFLFDCLDWIAKVDCNSFFNDLFKASWEEDSDKVALFFERDNENINLFERLLSKSGFENFHLLFYAIINHCINNNITQVDDSLKLYARICRNYIENIKQTTDGGISTESNVRIYNIKKYKEDFDTFSSNISNIENIAKIQDYVTLNSNPQINYLMRRLEEFPFTKGNIKAFDSVLQKCSDGELECNVVLTAVNEFYKQTPFNLTKSLVACGFTGINTGWCDGYRRKRIFFGRKDKLETLFRKNKDNNLPDTLLKLVEDYKKYGSMESVINNNTPTVVTTPVSYMLNYSDILAAQCAWLDNKEDAKFYFAMTDPLSDFDMIAMQKYNTNPLLSYNVCPMANAVYRKIKDIVKKDSVLQISYAGYGTNKGGICIYPIEQSEEDKILLNLKFYKYHWHLDKGYDSLSEEIKDKYLDSYPINDTVCYKLKQTDDKDLIESAQEFITTAYEYLMPQQ